MCWGHVRCQVLTTLRQSPGWKGFWSTTVSATVFCGCWLKKASFLWLFSSASQLHCWAHGDTCISASLHLCCAGGCGILDGSISFSKDNNQKVLENWYLNFTSVSMAAMLSQIVITLAEKKTFLMPMSTLQDGEPSESHTSRGHSPIFHSGA